MKIYYSSKFARQYKKLPFEIKRLAEEKQEIFRKDPFSASLETHKLTGKLENHWSFSIGPKHRIIFDLEDSGIVWFLAVGDHSIYSLFDRT